MTPAFSVSGGLGGLNDRMVSLEVTDNEGNQSDGFSMTLDDRDAAIVLPARGSLLSISMGYLETGLVFMGLFTVDDVDTSGYPLQVTITGRAADMAGALKQTRNAAYENKTLGQIVQEIAGRHDLQAMVSPSMASFLYKDLPQTAESDMAFLTNLARKHDGLFKVANGRLLMTKRGEGKSASGIFLGGVTIIGPLAGGSDVIDFNAKAMDRPKHSEAVGKYWDRDAAEEKEVKASSSQGPQHLLNYLHRDKEEAEADAESKAASMKRGEGNLSITIVGNPRVGAEMPLTVIGVRPGSADGLWRIKTAKHKIESSGYTTAIDAELPPSGPGESGGGGEISDPGAEVAREAASSVGSGYPSNPNTSIIGAH